MPVINLPDAYDAKLKTLAEPFVDTRESLIQRLIDEEVDRRGVMHPENGRGRPLADNDRRLNPDSPENLKFAKVCSATIDGRALNRPKWNNIMDQLHIEGLKRLGSFDTLQGASGARLRQGRFEELGFRYISEADLSIQGVDANLAWAHSLRLARALCLPIKVKLEWRNKEDAAHPGQSAVLEWAPPQT